MSFKKSTRGVYQSSQIPVMHGFGTKSLGDGRNSAVLSTIATDVLIIQPQQAHTNHVEIVGGSSNKPTETDGIITQEQNVLLTVITADCVPIIFYDPIQKIIGISHQGWKGTLDKLPKNMVDSFVELGSSPSDIVVAIGPAIGQCCYEVSSDLATDFEKEFGSSVCNSLQEKIYLNLLKANCQQIVSSGVVPQNIDSFPFCTSCNSDEFWSYRRDGGIRGEMVSFVMLALSS